MMNSKEYLNQVKYLSDIIYKKNRLIEILKDAEINISPVLKDICVSGTRDSHSREAIIAKRIDLENEVKANTEKLEAVSADIISTIKNLDDDEYAIVFNKHVECRSWDAIADELYISVATVRRKYCKALGKIEKILEFKKMSCCELQ